ncbi:metallophosphoesterase family protein [Frateuria hangzhouensis]|uniref:metallophosphoesterase family protein n=1 Tax=Frateuria hangzhouensis TaxID=2995589 RepID=UPI002260E270|nr:metallophosphoesterase [Frateuria sp. STR12]MCX7513546.1 metallophosphoesterase family protein [Frateuria sp. STR12]
MSVLLHMSDSHFGTERAPVLAALRRLVQASRPALVVLSGDLTQRARVAQFAAAHDFVQSLQVPFLAIPGNHDIPLFDLGKRLLAPYARYRRAFGEQLEPAWQSADWLVLGVNTTRWWRHKQGEVSPAQIERVSASLRLATPMQLRVVVVHQPMAVTRESDVGNLLRGHAQAARAWSDAGAQLVLGGHIHLPYVRPLPDPPDRPLWVVQAGTAVSHRVRGDVPNSVNLLRRATADACTVERWDYDPALDAFACHQRHALELRRRHAS